MCEDSLATPLRSILENKVIRRRKINQFWQPVPDWYSNHLSTGLSTQADAKLEGWKQAVVEVEEAVKD